MECILENITVHYETFGQGRPIIMLHGWPIDHRHILSFLEPLFERREGWKRIYPDLPGMGNTPGKDWLTHQDQMLDITLEFIDQVAPGQRFVLAGTSYGGYLARGLVHRRAEMIDGLLLTVPLIRAPENERTLPPHVTLVEDPVLLASLEPDEREVLLEMAVVQSRELLESIRADIFPAFETADHEFLSRLRENYAFSFDVDALTEPFPGPALFLMGRQDATCGYRDAWEILENYPRGTFVVLDRAGHLLEAEQRDLTHVLVTEWLDRVEEYAETVG
ncbi:MAG: alpha/beta hydrolase [Anaerolineae bacterium]|jgi:pimeloyl-ACP methyl ester carboxylesterase